MPSEKVVSWLMPASSSRRLAVRAGEPATDGSYSVSRTGGRLAIFWCQCCKMKCFSSGSPSPFYGPLP
eukprot:1671934-Prymnesium_polylepis.1